MDNIEPVFEIMNFLSEEEIQHVENISTKIQKTYNKGEQKKALTSGFDYRLIKKIIHEKLKKVLGDFGVTTCMILEEHIPWDIHTDYDKGDQHPYFACLISLDDDNKKTHTIIFNEEAKSIAEIKSLPVLNENMPSEVMSMVDHCNKDTLAKVSLCKVCRWQKGKLIAWDRKKLHTSDNFIKNSVKVKKALVLFTSRNI